MVRHPEHQLRIAALLPKAVLTVLCLCCIVNLWSQTFSSSYLGGESTVTPTSLCFGPDQRLYVLELDGRIYVHTIVRTGANNYDVTDVDTINLIKNIQNHNDDGTEHATVERLATGILVVGTPSAPVIYVTSSDYRVPSIFQLGADLNLDTNSGMISRLTKNGSSWTRVDLVRGLPRSEENHATNGLFLDQSTNTLYVAQGGNTNNGAPGFGLAYLCEFAYSAAILSVDLDYLETLQIQTDTGNGSSYLYNLPTVDDPTRNNANGINDPTAMGYNGIDLHDPFGGNDGLNQAKIEEDSPVQVYAPGFRNPYDVVMTQLGKLYSWDNGANAAYGTVPTSEGYGTATNNYPGETGTSYNIDGLHRINSPSYYAGHPTPIRCNPSGAGLYTYGVSGVFRTAYVSGNPSISLPYDWPPLPLSMANPIEGDFQIPGTADSSIYTIASKSMNGLCEYTSTNFDSAMMGDLLCTALNGVGSPAVYKLYRVNLNATGGVDHPDSVTIIASGNMTMPLDVITTGDGGPFPGTIWIANHQSTNNLTVLEPADFTACVGTDSYLIDEDVDGYTNGDEIDNGTSPCNGADMPGDHDGTLISGFKVSDLNDPDDDDDGINDSTDFFVWDPANGQSTTIPVEYPLLNGVPGEGFYGLGFTGLMMNGQDYLQLWKTEDNSSTEIIAGAAAGLLTYVNIDDGDALNAFDDQHNAFQFGFAVDSTDAPFIAEAQIQGPVFPDTIQDHQSMGMYISNGDQDNYVKIVINANGGTPGIAVVKENNGSSTTTQHSVSGVGTELSVRLALIVNPENGFVRAQYALGMDDLQDLGDGFYVQGALLTALKGPQAIAMGVISTARGSTNQYEATWAHLSIRHDPVTKGQWYTLQDGTDCETTGTPGSCCQARHEASYVQSGNKFYLLGGRENNSNVNIYNPATDTWTIGANPPGNSLHHFQAFDYYGLIIAAGAFSGSFPTETPVTLMRVYNPLTNTWHSGPTIPVARRRGAAGAVVKNDTLYLIGGATNGHIGGNVNWLDRYDFRRNEWGILPNAPHKRDHFHAAEKDGKLYAAAGRRTSLVSSDSLFLSTEPKVEVFNVASNTWSIVSQSIPTQRAGNSVAVLDDELIVIGGEREPGYSKNATEALHLEDLTWRTLDVMNTGRNGMQAIVNNSGIYVASGAAKRGGDSLIVSTEAFFMFGETEPVLVATDASELTAANQDFGDVPIQETINGDFYLYNTNGNQAILLQSLTMFDSTAFSLDTVLTFPRFLKPGDSLYLKFEFSPTMMQVYTDTLYLQHTGSNAPVKKVVLSGDGIFNWLGANRAYVDSSATGTGLGTSWPNAFTSMTAALDAAAEFTEITEVWIAKGTYKPSNTRSSSFVLRDDLALYGGFEGSEILLNQRDIEDYPVVFSGDIGVQNDSTDNVYHVVVMMSGIGDTATLDGVFIENGLANGGMAFDKHGAGVLNFGKLILRSSVIRNCISIDPGSALVNSGMSAYMILDNVAFHDNSDPHLVNIENAIMKWRGLTNLLQQE